VRSHELSGVRDGSTEQDDLYIKRTGTRAFMRMGGFTDEDFQKPIITVAAPYTNASSCNHHFDILTAEIVSAVEEAGGKAYVSYPPVITDGMAMGMEGQHKQK